MNDPLRDNRIFPEEMHQKETKIDQQPINLTWLWTLLIVIAVMALIWFGYRYYQKNMPIAEMITEEVILPTPEAQQSAFDSVRDASPVMERQERQEAINTLFGN